MTCSEESCDVYQSLPDLHSLPSNVHAALVSVDEQSVNKIFKGRLSKPCQAIRFVVLGFDGS